MVRKGIIFSVKDDGVRIKPNDSPDTVTPPIDAKGLYFVGDTVVFVIFDDGTGYIFGKM